MNLTIIKQSTFSPSPIIFFLFTVCLNCSIYKPLCFVILSSNLFNRIAKCECQMYFDCIPEKRFIFKQIILALKFGSFSFRLESSIASRVVLVGSTFLVSSYALEITKRVAMIIFFLR